MCVEQEKAGCGNGQTGNIGENRGITGKLERA